MIVRMIVIINLARGSSVSAVQRLSRSLDNQEVPAERRQTGGALRDDN